MSSLLKTEIDYLNDSWAVLEKVIRSLSEEQLTVLKRDRWSIKDHLAHLALAEQFCVAAFNGQPLHEAVGTDEETFLRSSEDELNEIGYQRTKSSPSSQVIAMRQEAHQQLLDTVARLTDADLQKPYSPYGSEPTGMTMLDILRGNTYEHYALHRGWIEETLRQEGSAHQ